jgi:hypothetical protein
MIPASATQKGSSRPNAKMPRGKRKRRFDLDLDGNNSQSISTSRFPINGVVEPVSNMNEQSEAHNHSAGTIMTVSDLMPLESYSDLSSWDLNLNGMSSLLINHSSLFPVVVYQPSTYFA